MTGKIILATVAAVAATTFVGCNKPDLKSDKGQASYAIGQQIGKNLKQQNIDIDPATLAASLEDAVKGTPSKMKDDEIQKAMMKLQENAMKKQQEEGETNKKKSAEFLEKNKAATGVKVTASGLQYSVITEGAGAVPKEDTVKCHYTGTLIDGTKFDSSVDRGQPAEFPVAGVIPGWTEALQMMKVGSKYKLFIPPELAYGASGRPGIPANSALIFEVELLDIVKATAPAKPAAKPAAKK